MGIEIARPGQFTSVRQDNGKNGIEIFKAAYFNRLINIHPDSLIAYWPMDETAGLVATDYSGRANNAAYSGVTLNNDPGPDSRGCPRFDGINDYCNIHSAGFNADFDGNHGSTIIWAKVLNAGVWADGAIRLFLAFYINAGNYIWIYKNIPNNQYIFIRQNGLGIETYTGATTTTDWFCFGMTWDTTVGVDEVKYYFNGTLMQTDNGLGNIAGNLDANRTLIGAGLRFPVVQFSWNGWLAHCAVWNRALSEDDVRLISRV